MSESTFESRELVPKAPMTLEDYLVDTAQFYELFGTVPQDIEHGFYIYMVNRYPQWKNIDGVSLLNLYEKNVLDGGMKLLDFYQYCLDNDFPCPITEYKSSSELWDEFRDYAEALDEEQMQAYADWAVKHDIKVHKGATMRFTDEAGTEYTLRTDPSHWGTPLPD